MAIRNEHWEIVSGKTAVKKATVKKQPKVVWEEVWFLWERDEEWAVYDGVITGDGSSSFFVRARSRQWWEEKVMKIEKNRIRFLNK